MNQARLIVFSLFLSSLAFSQDAGVVKGVVTDENNKPIAHMRVHLAEDKAVVGHRILRIFETNTQGEFEITGVAWGHYYVVTEKEAAGYPDTELAFYSNLSVPKVEVSPNVPTSEVKLRLGPKAAVLAVKSVADASTALAVHSASVTLRRADNPQFSITTSAGGAILIPAATDVTVEVTAPGYQKWTWAADDGSSEKLRLASGESRTLEVQLQPE
jgi:hypothetical protein